MSTAEKEALKTLTPELMGIPVSKITYPNMPVATFALEMESLKETYLKDSAYNAKRKIDTALLADKLDLAVGALRASEIDWTKEVQASTEVNE